MGPLAPEKGRSTHRAARRASHTGRAPGRLPGWTQSQGLAWLALGLLLAALAALLLHETRGTTLWFDEWEYAIDRPANDLGTLLDPHGEHLSLVPIAIYKLLFATAGLDHYLPYRALVTALHLICVALVFTYALRRAGPLPALLAAVLLGTLGPGWQNFLWPFQIAWLISLGAGLGALLMLDRRDRMGDVAASLLLALSLAGSGLGLPIAAGIAVDVGWGRRRLRDAWIVAAPLALYVPWWIAYRPAGIARHQVVLVLDFAADSAAAVMNALSGLTQSPIGGSAATLGWGRPLAVAAVALLLWRLAAVRPIPPRVIALLTILVSFWVLTGLRRAGLAVGNESRYVYVGVFFALPLIAELARGLMVPARAVPAAVAAVAVIAVANLGDLREAGRFLRGVAATTRADLGALELGRRLVGPDYVATRMTGYPLVVVRAGRYFAAADAHGSPAATPAEIAAAAEPARRVADAELADIHRVALAPAPRTSPTGEPPTVDATTGGTTKERGACVRFAPLGAAPAASTRELQLTLPPGGLQLSAEGAPLTVALRRFADGFPTEPRDRIAAGATAVLRIGSDAAPQPWHVRVAPEGRVTACGLGTGP